jgi:hypothetical protein
MNNEVLRESEFFAPCVLVLALYSFELSKFCSVSPASNLVIQIALSDWNVEDVPQ